MKAKVLRRLFLPQRIMMVRTSPEIMHPVKNLATFSKSYASKGLDLLWRASRMNFGIKQFC